MEILNTKHCQNNKYSRRYQLVSEVQAAHFLAWIMLLLHNHIICTEVNFSLNHYNKNPQPSTSSLGLDMCYISQCIFGKKLSSSNMCYRTTFTEINWLTYYFLHHHALQFSQVDNSPFLAMTLRTLKEDKQIDAEIRYFVTEIV